MRHEGDNSAKTCASCGRPTSNPRFCDRSCAAQHNNRTSPKRRPQGSCADCGAAIPTRLQRCEICRSSAEAARAREDANIQTFRTVDGEVRELAVPKVWIHDAVVFDISAHGGAKLTLNDSCGSFLGRLLGVVFARPAYLRTEDIHRYAALIYSFREHRLEEPGWPPKRRTVAVAELPLKHLDYALRHWVEAAIPEVNHPLLATLALDASRFIDAHAGGTSRSQPNWRLKGLVDGFDEYGSRRVDDPRLKREITSRLKGVLASVRIPPGCRITDTRRQQDVLGENASCQFIIERCHLSSGFYDYVDLCVVEASPPTYDIADEFHLRGGLRLATVREDHDDHISIAFHRYPMVEIPGRWITAVQARDADYQPSWRDVPHWVP